VFVSEVKRSLINDNLYPENLKDYNKKLFFRSIVITSRLTEVERALVALPDFKSGVRGE